MGRGRKDTTAGPAERRLIVIALEDAPT
jgi:hypothetical protein